MLKMKTIAVGEKGKSQKALWLTNGTEIHLERTMANRKNIIIKEYQKEKNVDEMATRASNDGIYTVDSFIKTLHYFFEGNEVVLATPHGYLRTSLDKAETMCRELSEIIPMVRDDIKEGRKPMDSRSIGKMLGSDFV